MCIRDSRYIPEDVMAHVPALLEKVITMPWFREYGRTFDPVSYTHLDVYKRQGLYNSRIVKLVNKKGQLKSSIIIDELPTIYFRGIDNLIAVSYTHLGIAKLL